MSRKSRGIATVFFIALAICLSFPFWRGIRVRLTTNRPCDCPYDRDSRDYRCGGRSAHTKPGGREPTCYLGDFLWMQRDLT